MRHRQKKSLMTIPYRIRRGIRHTLVALGILVLLGAAAGAAWMLWLNRYVVYTDEGARLDFNKPFGISQGQIAIPPEPSPSVPISYGNTDDLTALPAGALKQLEGWVVTADMLKEENFSATKAVLEKLPLESTVLMDVRNVRGEFFYTSALSVPGKAPKQVDVAAVTELFEILKSKECYLIARFPAFRDRWYFLEDERNRVPYGLPIAGGNGSLWEDVSIPGMSHYWFDPTETGTLDFLVKIVTELRSLGFDEVVFSDFRFPNTDKITFEGDKMAALNEAAEVLVKACATDYFAVSFVGSHIALPEGRSRLYFENVPAADIAGLVSSIAVSDPAAQLVFFTDLMDTRYETYSVLRPLELANG